ncbi:hypothetical protein J437_LFUL001515 [Ladona fulva]|uniref:Uncharacterized protein n=1 Tax=Ladona fulva TaxID=123851 RepID=A0A8K0JWP8_LADFU|nr:hypothetical protein J437_LFUL001515 [Ladona fulva]
MRKMRIILIIAVVFAVIALAFSQDSEEDVPDSDEADLEERFLRGILKKLLKKGGRNMLPPDDDIW